MEVMNGDDGKPLSTGMIVAICISAFAVSKGVLFFIWCWRRKKMRSDCEVKLAGTVLGLLLSSAACSNKFVWL